MTAQRPLILLENVSKIYPVKKRIVEAVKEVSLCIDEGEFLIITGRSGSGKTTLLNLISGLAKPTGGRIWLEEIDVWNMPDEQQSLLRNQKIGFVFQFPSLMPSLTVLENVLLPTVIKNGDSVGEYEQRAHELLKLTGLEDKLDAYPRQLSAGQQQRVVIARSLIKRPELLLADEPTSNLDEQTEVEIMELLQQVHRENQITVLLVTHSEELVSYGTRAIRMAGGQIVN